MRNPKRAIALNYLITGGCGFLGSNLASYLILQGETVHIFDDVSGPGSALNLEWLRTQGDVRFTRGDIRNASQVEDAVRSAVPDAVFHLAGQVAMTTSLVDPRHDFTTNALGTLNLLEAVRALAKDASVVYASSNKVYGDLSGVELVEGVTRYSPASAIRGIDESAPLDFRSPYGCSKGAADQYVLDYARNYGLNTVVFRHSTMYGARQFGTFDQGWVGWFIRQALEARADPARPPFTISGDGKQVRDLLYVSDAVRCYMAAVEHIDIARGNAFNIGGGMENSMSLLELFAYLENQLHITLAYQMVPARPSDQRFFVADNSKAKIRLGWSPMLTKANGIASALELSAPR